jgi:hypothetical protein
MRFILWTLLVLMIGTIAIVVEREHNDPNSSAKYKVDIPLTSSTEQRPGRWLQWYRDAEKAHLTQKTPSGVPLSFKKRYIVGRTRFDVPVGYFLGWPREDFLFGLHERNDVRFAFWMPDRAYPLRKEPTIGSYLRGPEPGRENPAENEFIVVISLVQFEVTKTLDTRISAETMIENVLNNTKDDAKRTYDLGLSRIDDLFLTYYKLKSELDNVSLIIDCPTSEGMRLPYPTCWGHVHFHADDLGFRFTIPVNALRYWRETMDTARAMILEWRDAATP